MKSKKSLFIIASFVLATVASLVFGLAALKIADAEPATVSAESTTRYYFYNANIDTDYGLRSNVKVYAFNDTENNSWPGQEMSNVSGTSWYYADLNDKYTTIIFTGNDNNGDLKQTSNITLSSDNVYYVSGGWYDGKFNYGSLLIDGIENTSESITFATAETTTYYYFNSSSWSGVNAHLFNSSLNAVTTAWPGVTMTDEGRGWYSVEVYDCFDRIIFNNSSNNSDQTSTINLGDDAYYYGGWYETKADASYYLVGSLQSKAWDPSLVEYPFEYVNTVTFSYKGIALSEGVQFKFGIHGGYDNGFNGGNNITIDETGVYDILINNFDHTYSLTKVSTEELDLQELKGKASVDKDYMLLICAFDLSAIDEYGSYAIGFTINGVDYDSDTYFTSVAIKTDEDSYTVKSAGDIYEKEGYALIVYEAEVPAGTNEYYIRGYVKNGGDIVSSTTRHYATVTR